MSLTDKSIEDLWYLHTNSSPMPSFVSLRNFVRAIDAERGKDATAWRILDKSGETLRLSESSADVRFCQAEGFPNVPLFLSPTIPEGMVMVDKKLLSTTIKLTKEASETEFNRQPLSDELYGVSLMLAAAQGERNVNTF